VDHGTTGFLVRLEAVGPTDVEPRHPEQFSRELAEAVNRLISDPDLRGAMARAARTRVERQFSWTSIARQTLEWYERIIQRHTADLHRHATLP